MGVRRNGTSRISRLRSVFTGIYRGKADDTVIDNTQQNCISPSHAASSTAFSSSGSPLPSSNRATSDEVMSGQAVQIKKLNPAATTAARKCGEWLRNASFRTFENYEICADNEEVVTRSEEFFQHFEPSSKSSANEIRIVAIRFKTSATVPVKAGSIVDLIPVCIISKTPSISGKVLEIGQYVQLTGAALVEPEFCCLLLLSQ